MIIYIITLMIIFEIIGSKFLFISSYVDSKMYVLYLYIRVLETSKNYRLVYRHFIITRRSLK